MLPGKPDGPPHERGELLGVAGVGPVGSARDLDLAGVAARGARIDRTLHLLPRPIARKRVALLVESAGRAGYHQAAHEREGIETS